MIGRAGIGVDNVDVPAATKRGIIVANAPQSNIVAAAEHTIALMLALARNVPQAHASLTAGGGSGRGSAAWRSMRRRSACSGSAGSASSSRRGRARSGCTSSPSTRSSGPSASASSARRRPRRPPTSTARPTSSPCTCPGRRRRAAGSTPRRSPSASDGVRVINCARGELVDDAALKDALDSGKVAGAALDVFPSEPITDYPLFEGYPNVVVTPHLGASTTEAQDRAGVQTAEQMIAALTGGVVSTAVNIPAIAPEDMDVLGPFIPLVDRLGRLAVALAEGAGIDRVEVEYFGRIAERDTRLLTLAVLQGVLRRPLRGGGQPRQRRRPGRGARHRRLRAQGGRRARLHRPRPDHDRGGRRALPRRGHHVRPPRPPAPARGLGPALQPAARRGRAPRAVPLLRPAGDDGPRRAPRWASAA